MLTDTDLDLLKILNASDEDDISGDDGTADAEEDDDDGALDDEDLDEEKEGALEEEG